MSKLWDDFWENLMYNDIGKIVAEQDAIPEFRRFNIMESELRSIVWEAVQEQRSWSVSERACEAWAIIPS